MSGLKTTLEILHAGVKRNEKFAQNEPPQSRTRARYSGIATGYVEAMACVKINMHEPVEQEVDLEHLLWQVDGWFNLYEKRHGGFRTDGDLLTPHLRRAVRENGKRGDG